MRMKRRWAIVGLACVSIMACACTSVDAGRLLRYNRATGQVTSYQANYAQYDISQVTSVASNSTSLAYGCASGLYMVNLATGATTQISTNAVTTKVRLSEKYATWNGTLLNLTTSSTRATNANAMLSGDYAAYGSGASYTAENLVTGVKTTITAANGMYLVGMTNGSIIVQDGKTDNGFGRWTMHYSQYDAATGLATGWTNTAHTGANVTASDCLVSDSWFFGSFTDSSGGPIYDSRTLSSPYTGVDGRSFQPVYNGGPAIYGDTVACVTGMGYYVSALGLGTNQTSTLYSTYPTRENMDPKLWGVAINGSYVTWFDNGVPEPSSLLALVGLLGSAGFLLRKRSA